MGLLNSTPVDVVLKKDVADENTSADSSTNWVSPNYLQVKQFITKDIGDSSYLKYGGTTGSLFSTMYQSAGNYAMASDLVNYQTAGSYAMASDLANYQPVGSYAMKSDLVSYQPAGSYQSAGNYAMVSDLIAYQTAGSYALENHNHDGLYQPKGEYQTAGNYVLTSDPSFVNVSNTVTKNKVLWCADGNACNVPIGINGNSVIEFGSGVSGKEGNAGKIGYGTFDKNASLNIIGAGTKGGSRIVRVWDNLTIGGTASIDGTASLNGIVNVGGSNNLRLEGSENNRIIQSYGNRPLAINPIGSNAINLGNTSNATNVLGNLNVSGGITAGNTPFRVFELTGKFAASLPSASIDLSLPSGVVTGKVMMYYGMTKNTNGDSIPWNAADQPNWIVNSYLKSNNILNYRNVGSNTTGKDFTVVLIVKP